MPSVSNTVGAPKGVLHASQPIVVPMGSTTAAEDAEEQKVTEASDLLTFHHDNNDSSPASQPPQQTQQTHHNHFSVHRTTSSSRSNANNNSTSHNPLAGTTPLSHALSPTTATSNAASPNTHNNNNSTSATTPTAHAVPPPPLTAIITPSMTLAEQIEALKRSNRVMRGEMELKDAKIQQLAKGLSDTVTTMESHEERVMNRLLRKVEQARREKEVLLAHKRAEESRKALEEEKLRKISAERGRLAERLRAEEDMIRSRLSRQLSLVQKQRKALQGKVEAETTTLHEVFEAFVNYQQIEEHAAQLVNMSLNQQQQQPAGATATTATTAAAAGTPLRGPASSSSCSGIYSQQQQSAPLPLTHHARSPSCRSQSMSLVGAPTPIRGGSVSAGAAGFHVDPHQGGASIPTTTAASASAPSASSFSDAFMIKQLQKEIRRARGLQADMRNRAAEFQQKRELMEERLFNWMNRRRYEQRLDHNHGGGAGASSTTPMTTATGGNATAGGIGAASGLSPTASSVHIPISAAGGIGAASSSHYHYGLSGGGSHQHHPPSTHFMGGGNSSGGATAAQLLLANANAMTLHQSTGGGAAGGRGGSSFSVAALSMTEQHPSVLLGSATAAHGVGGGGIVGSFMGGGPNGSLCLNDTDGFFSDVTTVNTSVAPYGSTSPAPGSLAPTPTPSHYRAASGIAPTTTATTMASGGNGAGVLDSDGGHSSAAAIGATPLSAPGSAMNRGGAGGGGTTLPPFVSLANNAAPGPTTTVTRVIRTRNNSTSTFSTTTNTMHAASPSGRGVRDPHSCGNVSGSDNPFANPQPPGSHHRQQQQQPHYNPASYSSSPAASPPRLTAQQLQRNSNMLHVLLASQQQQHQQDGGEGGCLPLPVTDTADQLPSGNDREPTPSEALQLLHASTQQRFQQHQMTHSK